MGVKTEGTSESDDKNKIVKVKPITDEEVSCWNCFSSESSPPEPLPLSKIRAEHRDKLKLYPFLASELTKPKVIPLKQKMREPYALSKKIDEEITNNVKQNDISVTFSDPEFETEVTEKVKNKKFSDNFFIRKRKITKEKPEVVPKSISQVIEPDKEDEKVSYLYRVNIETPSIKVKRDENVVTSTPGKRKINVPESLSVESLESPVSISKITFENKEPDDSSCASDSGYACSVVNRPGSRESYDTNDGVAPLGSSRGTTPSPHDTIKARNLHNLGSLPALSTTKSDTEPIGTSTYSLCDRSCEKKPQSKQLRWSTLSMCKNLHENDEVFSDTLSPGHGGHATLPRRSNSPLPHDRDLDRDRFPLNRSGLQTRSESMASVYSGAGEGTRNNVTVRGEVQLSLLYNYRLGALEVGVRRCRDLAAVDTKRNRSDPYVKVYLLPDKSKAGKRKTKVKKNTLNPVFEETLSFTQPLASLSSRTLWLSVWHADMFGRNDFLGEVTLPLADVVFDDPQPTWHKLLERTEQFDEQQGTRGDLIIGLKFELTESNASQGKGTLHVLVKEAKNLVANKPNGLADAFCKSYLLPERGRLTKQKTNVVRRSLNPRWEHTFTYRGLTMQELATRALELSIWDRDRLASNDFMGAVRLSLGSGTYMGASVNWMDSVGKEVSLWQTMMQRPNFWVEGSLPLRPQLNN